MNALSSTKSPQLIPAGSHLVPLHQCRIAIRSLEKGAGQGAQQARVHGASKSQTRLSMCTHTCAHAHTHTHTSECQPPSEGPGSGIRRQARAGLDSDCRRGLTHSLPEGKAAAALVVLSAECSSQAAAFTALHSPSSQSYDFYSSHVCMWELDHKGSWAPKNWCFWTVVLEKTLESPLDSKELKPVNPKGNQSWIFIWWTDTEAEAPVLWPPDAKSWLIGKDPDAGKDWRQEEKGTTEDEMVGWHHQLDGHEFKQALGVGDGQGSLECCSPWGCKELDITEQLNWAEPSPTQGERQPLGPCPPPLPSPAPLTEKLLVPQDSPPEARIITKGL